MNKKILIILLYCSLLVFNGQTCAQDLVKLLPDSSQISPFIASEEAIVFEKDKLYQHINGAADIYLEYGFESVLNQQYSDDQSTIVLDIYRMSDSEAAFGIYSLFRDPNKPALNIGDDGVEFEYQISFWQEKYYVVLMGYDNSADTKKMLFKIAHTVSDKLGSSTGPKILEQLLINFKVARSEGTIKGLLALNRKLFLTKENILNIDGKSKSAAFASYQSEHGKAELLLIFGPDRLTDLEKVEEIFSKKYTLHTTTPFKIFRDQRNRFYCAQALNNLCIFHKASSKQVILDILQ
jgi:hypothetical protein